VRRKWKVVKVVDVHETCFSLEENGEEREKVVEGREGLHGGEGECATPG
jgi:hypothetical protein